MKLTEKERAGLWAVVKNGLYQMGGKTAVDLNDDNCSWFNAEDIMRGMNVNRHEAAGIMSALDAKGLVSEHEPKEWVLSNVGIDTAIECGM